jgi:signal-transduction protein with cAMP-binding, CBS, and nucleotidyltransferase domain
MDALTFLRACTPLFEGVSVENLSALAQASTLQTYKTGQFILLKGTTVDGLHVIVAGSAGVFVKPANRPSVQIAALSSGDVCGETSIVETGVANATVKALEDDTMVLVIPQAAFRHVLQQDEGFAVRVNTLITARKSAAVPA